MGDVVRAAPGGAGTGLPPENQSSAIVPTPEVSQPYDPLEQAGCLNNMERMRETAERMPGKTVSGCGVESCVDLIPRFAQASCLHKAGSRRRDRDVTSYCWIDYQPVARGNPPMAVNRVSIIAEGPSEGHRLTGEL